MSIWSATRVTRAVISFWDNNLVYGLLDGGSKHKSADKGADHSLYVPMLTVVIFCVVELCPIWYVLDGSFVDVFICEELLIKNKGIYIPLLDRDEEEQEG